MNVVLYMNVGNSVHVCTYIRTHAPNTASMKIDLIQFTLAILLIFFMILQHTLVELNSTSSPFVGYLLEARAGDGNVFNTESGIVGTFEPAYTSNAQWHTINCSSSNTLGPTYPVSYRPVSCRKTIHAPYITMQH